MWSKRQVKVRGAGISTITLSTVIQNLRIKTGKSPITVDDLSRTNRRIAIVHPHTYGEESCLTPEVVQSIADALGSIPSLPVPNVVIAAGYEASRVRSLSRPCARDNDADISLPAMNQDLSDICMDRSSVFTKVSDKSDPRKSRKDDEYTLSIIRPPTYQRSSSFEFPKPRPTSIVTSLNQRPTRIFSRSRKVFWRRFVTAWKRVTAAMHHRPHNISHAKSTEKASFPPGFEPVGLRNPPWWRPNSFSRKRRSMHPKSTRSSISYVE